MSPLSQKQLQAVKLLASGKNQSEVASHLGVNRRTIARWCENPEFTEAVATGRPKVVQKLTESVSLKTTELIEVNLPKAIKTVVHILDDVEARNCDKLRAAQLLGKWAGLEKNSEADTKSQPELDLRAYLLSLSNKN
ncbi:helix-turn-helix domain-containing protein [Tolypothrix sp. VBCCA 56010]|uniref:helix-turn-helix domain-containing protein n=1 Tax=Tolypothrix sp. VBCCA 56010 TaxID=3137731 RepID=UPI003D7C710C